MSEFKSAIFLVSFSGEFLRVFVCVIYVILLSLRVETDSVLILCWAQGTFSEDVAMRTEGIKVLMITSTSTYSNGGSFFFCFEVHIEDLSCTAGL